MGGGDGCRVDLRIQFSASSNRRATKHASPETIVKP
jgi:hypothetical protein